MQDGAPHRLSSALNVKGWSDQHCGPGADSARLCRFGDPKLTRPPHPERPHTCSWQVPTLTVTSADAGAQTPRPSPGMGWQEQDAGAGWASRAGPWGRDRARLRAVGGCGSKEGLCTVN